MQSSVTMQIRNNSYRLQTLSIANPITTQLSLSVIHALSIEAQFPSVTQPLLCFRLRNCASKFKLLVGSNLIVHMFLTNDWLTLLVLISKAPSRIYSWQRLHAKTRVNSHFSGIFEPENRRILYFSPCHSFCCPIYIRCYYYPPRNIQNQANAPCCWWFYWRVLSSGRGVSLYRVPIKIPANENAWLKVRPSIRHECVCWSTISSW